MRILTFLDSRYIGDSIFLSKKVISLNLCHFDIINIILLLKYQTEFQCLSQKQWPSIFHVAWNLWSNHLKNSMTRTILSHDWELLHQQASQNRREYIYIFLMLNTFSSSIFLYLDKNRMNLDFKVWEKACFVIQLFTHHI